MLSKGLLKKLRVLISCRRKQESTREDSAIIALNLNSRSSIAGKGPERMK